MRWLKKFAAIASVTLLGLKGLVSLFAQINANRKPEGRAALMTSRERVSSAVKGLLLTNTVKPVGVSRVEKGINQDVYCLTVSGHGCFVLASGAIVSNCDAFGYFVVYEHPIAGRLTEKIRVSR